jgi:hypothetical protein
MTYIFRLSLGAALALAEPAWAQQTIIVSARDCAELARHVADDDVSYQPGVDVQGRAVVAADLPGSPAPSRITTFAIPIELPVSRFLGPNASRQLQDSDIIAGYVTIDSQTGHVLLDGQEISDSGHHAIAAECAKRKKNR